MRRDPYLPVAGSDGTAPRAGPKRLVTLFVFGSITDKRTFVARTQTAPSPAAMSPPGPGTPTSMVATTSFVLGSILETVPSAWFRTHTAPSPTARNRGRPRTAMVATTALVAGSTRWTEPFSAERGSTRIRDPDRPISGGGRVGIGFHADAGHDFIRLGVDPGEDTFLIRQDPDPAFAGRDTRLRIGDRYRDRRGHLVAPGVDPVNRPVLATGDPHRTIAGGHRGAGPVDLHLGDDLVGIGVDALNGPEPLVGDPERAEADLQPIGKAVQVDRGQCLPFDGHEGFRIVVDGER